MHSRPGWGIEAFLNTPAAGRMQVGKTGACNGAGAWERGTGRDTWRRGRAAATPQWKMHTVFGRTSGGSEARDEESIHATEES